MNLEAPYFRKVRPGYSGNSENTFNQERNPAAASRDAQIRMSYRRKRASSCFLCQKSHKTCDNERPCRMCIKRGTHHACYDGFCKKQNYIDDVPGTSIMDMKLPICSNNGTQAIQHKDQHEESKDYVTPGEYLSFEHSLPKNTASGKRPCRIPPSGYLQFSLDFAGESNSQKEPKNPTDQQSVIPDSHLLDDLSSWNFLSQRDELNIIPAPDVHFECASTADNQLAFTIREGWRATFV